jgi:hypothetical protein
MMSPHACRKAAMVTVVVAALAGCASQSAVDRAAVVRSPVLLSAGDLALPPDCAPTPGVVYRTEYVVGEGGGVDHVARVEGPACLQAALTGWVSTFRYEPGTPTTHSIIDWMATVARK